MASATRILKPEEAARVDRGRFDSEKINRPTITFWQGAWRRLKKNPIAVSAMILLGVLAVFILLGPLVSGENYLDINLALKNAKPNGVNWFGTDAMGRDLFCRVWIGARLSLLVALVCSFIQIAVGCAYGGAMAYFGGVVDAVIMRIADMCISFPGLVLAIAIAGMLGPNMVNAVIAISAVSWTKYARLSRSMVLKICKCQYIEAAVSTGTTTGNILLKYVVPNMITTMVVTAATDMGSMMLELASLSFLGVGATAPTPEWGLMLNEGRTYIAKAPWLMIYPGIAIVIVVIIFNMLGDSLRDILDPRQE